MGAMSPKPKIIRKYRDYALPYDAYQSVVKNVSTCKNLGLILDKYQPWGDCSFDNGDRNWALNFQYRDSRRNRQGNQNQEHFVDSSEAKGYWINPSPRFPPAHPEKQLRPNAHFDEKLHAKFIEKYLDNMPRKPLRLITQSRLIVGNGTKGTLEMGITLHRIFGIPYIPGSALKGLARSFALNQIAEKFGIPYLSGKTLLEIKQQKEKGESPPPPPLKILDALLELPLNKNLPTKQYQEQLSAINKFFENQLKQSPYFVVSKSKIDNLSVEAFLKDNIINQFREIFGTMSKIGEIVFYDSIPLKIKNILVAEIMTPHFADYYRGTEYPQEDQDPQPLVFLAVREGIPFAFCLDYRKKGQEDQTLFKTARHWLLAGLNKFGVGGKTSSGMGLLTTASRSSR
jgi:CRISPR-associated protein Cmr6